jgi:hypothetical protein
MTKTEAMERLDALTQAVEQADLASIASIGSASMTGIIQSVASNPDISQAERQAKARIAYLERAIRSNDGAPSTNDIEKLRRRAGRAVLALRDAVEMGQPSPSATAG